MVHKIYTEPITTSRSSSPSSSTTTTATPTIEAPPGSPTRPGHSSLTSSPIISSKSSKVCIIYLIFYLYLLPNVL